MNTYEIEVRPDGYYLDGVKITEESMGRIKFIIWDDDDIVPPRTKEDLTKFVPQLGHTYTIQTEGRFEIQNQYEVKCGRCYGHGVLDDNEGEHPTGYNCPSCGGEGNFWVDCEHPANYTLSEEDYEFRQVYHFRPADQATRIDKFIANKLDKLGEPKIDKEILNRMAEEDFEIRHAGGGPFDDIDVRNAFKRGYRARARETDQALNKRI